MNVVKQSVMFSSISLNVDRIIMLIATMFSAHSHIRMLGDHMLYMYSALYMYTVVQYLVGFLTRNHNNLPSCNHSAALGAVLLVNANSDGCLCHVHTQPPNLRRLVMIGHSSLSLQ